MSGQCYEDECSYKKDNMCTVEGRCPKCNGSGQVT